MRVAVVGGGYWGSKHVRVLSGLSDVSQVVLVDLDAGRRDQLAHAFPALECESELETALESVDAAVIATPPTTHAPLASMAIAAGVHVLVEKPLATSVIEAEQLVQQARDAGVTLMVGHTFEYNAAVRRLKEIIESGRIGNVHYIDAARLNLGLFQPDVNVIWDLAPHDLSIINYLLDGTPTRVTAWGKCLAHPAYEDVATLRLDYDHHGVTAHVRVSWLDPCKTRRVTVVGSRQMAVYDDMATDERLRIYDKGVDSIDPAETLHEFPWTYRQGDIVSPYVEFGEPLLAEDQDFVSAVRDGTTPRASGESGLAVVRILDAAQRSLRADHQTVAVESPEIWLGRGGQRPETGPLVGSARPMASSSRGDVTARGRSAAEAG